MKHFGKQVWSSNAFIEELRFQPFGSFVINSLWLSECAACLVSYWGRWMHLHSAECLDSTSFTDQLLQEVLLGCKSVLSHCLGRQTELNVMMEMQEKCWSIGKPKKNPTFSMKKQVERLWLNYPRLFMSSRPQNFNLSFTIVLKI